MVSRCFPGGYNVKLYISRGRLAWWLLAFLHSANLAYCSYSRRYVRLVMKQAQPFIGQKLYRNTYSLDVLAEDLGIGQYIDFYLLDSPRTIFPEAFATALGTTVYGREMKFVEVNIDSTFTIIKHGPVAKQSMYNVYFKFC